VFVPTAFVGGVNAFDQGVEPEERICSWQELRALQSGNVSVQAHGVDHRAFSALAERALRDELAGAKSAIEAALGSTVEVYAYPYGDAGERERTAPLVAEAGYRAAFLYGGGPLSLDVPLADRYAIPRLAMGPDSDLRAMLEDWTGADPVTAPAAG
jgi:peptidoglycan/xylan/chitin deacetylase (PgdA/CDA1 family)